jgi:hypothetical protein
LTELHKKTWVPERVGFEPTVRITANAFEFYDSRAGVCRTVPNRAVLLAIFLVTVLSCEVLCRTMSRSWFAIWFANFAAYVCSRLLGDTARERAGLGGALRLRKKSRASAASIVA